MTDKQRTLIHVKIIIIKIPIFRRDDIGRLIGWIGITLADPLLVDFWLLKIERWFCQTREGELGSSIPAKSADLKARLVS